MPLGGFGETAGLDARADALVAVVRLHRCWVAVGLDALLPL